jgi:hypothetical protein
MEPEKWTHTIHRNGIVFWSWNYHIMESYHWDHTKKMEPFQGDGIIPWDHTKAMESYYGIPRRWNHTMGSYQGDGIIPKPWNYTKTESYHTILRDFLTTFIYQNKSIQNNNMKLTCK